jgi:hypothetical protein
MFRALGDLAKAPHVARLRYLSRGFGHLVHHPCLGPSSGVLLPSLCPPARPPGASGHEGTSTIPLIMKDLGNCISVSWRIIEA